MDSKVSEDSDENAKTHDGRSDASPSTSPSEAPASIRTRLFILFAFWGVVAFLGLPHWLQSTSIHRSNLPLESMNNWAEGKSCKIHYPLHVRLICQDDELEYTQRLAAQVHSHLNAGGNEGLYSFEITADLANGTYGQEVWPPISHDSSSYQQSALIVNLQTDKKAKSSEASLRSLVPVLDVRHNPSRTKDAASLSTFVASEIRKVFDHERHAISYLLEGSPFTNQNSDDQLTPETEANLDTKSTRAFKYASTYHLTFSLFTSSGSPSAWDVEQALEETILPLLDRMSSISKFTVDTQVQLYASFSPSMPEPRYNPTSRAWQLQKSDLSGFINAAEWPLSPSIGSGPTINFVLYVPSKDKSPLVLAETGGNSWIIPQWGGVQILNPTAKQSERLSANDLRPIMITFADQLLSLIGLPPSPSSLSLRIATLTRERATSLIISASSTLGALARLTLKLTSIAIPDTVAKSVTETIHRLDQACQHIQEGQYQRALEDARIAEDEAEQAFFEPSMVGQVYFPDEHKVAVYVPLLGPMAVPLVISALKELQRFRQRKSKVA